jgi:hypothetical protein
MSSDGQTNSSTQTPGQANQSQPAQQSVRDEVLGRVADVLPVGVFPRMIAENELYEIQRSLRGRVGDDHKRQRAILDRELGFDKDDIKYDEPDGADMANFSVHGNTNITFQDPLTPPEPPSPIASGGSLLSKVLPWAIATLGLGTGFGALVPIAIDWLTDDDTPAVTSQADKWYLDLKVTDEP